LPPALKASTSCLGQRSISDSIYDQAKTNLVRPLKRVQVKGRQTEFMVYELLALARAKIRWLREGDNCERDDVEGLARVRGMRIFRTQSLPIVKS
jgi:hypothetical protein